MIVDEIKPEAVLEGKEPLNFYTGGRGEGFGFWVAWQLERMAECFVSVFSGCGYRFKNWRV